jgi:hypothetical protein
LFFAARAGGAGVKKGRMRIRKKREKRMERLGTGGLPS